MINKQPYDDLHNTLWNKIEEVKSLTNVYQDIILNDITAIFKDMDLTYKYIKQKYEATWKKIDILISNICQRLPNEITGFCKNLTLFQSFWKKEIEMIEQRKKMNNMIIENFFIADTIGKNVKVCAVNYLKGYYKCQKADKEAQENFLRCRKKFEEVYEKSLANESLKSFNKSSKFNIDDLSSNETIKRVENDYVKSLTKYQEKNSDFLKYSPEGMGDDNKVFFKEIGRYFRKFEDVFKLELLSSCTTSKAFMNHLTDYQERLQNETTDFTDIFWTEIYFNKYCKKNNLLMQPIKKINLKDSNEFATNISKLSDVTLLNTDTILYKTYNNYWNDKKYAAFFNQIKQEVRDIIQNMFSQGLTYIDNKDFNIELTDNVAKAFDYFNIEKNTFKDDLKFLVKLIVSIWQGYEMQTSLYEKFKAVYNSKASYYPIILIILITFRVITPQKRFLPSQSSYEDICKIIRTCLDKSLKKKEVFQSSEMVLILTSYGQKKIDEKGKNKTTYLYSNLSDHKIWTYEGFWRARILTKITYLIMNSSNESNIDDNSKDEEIRLSKVKELKEVHIKGVFSSEAISIKCLRKDQNDYENIIFPMMRLYQIGSESQEEVKIIFNS